MLAALKFLNAANLYMLGMELYTPNANIYTGLLHLILNVFFVLV